MNATLMISDERPMNSIASSRSRRYGSAIAHMATGRENLAKQKAHSAPDSISGVFLCLKYRFMVAVCGQASAWLGSFCPSILTPHTAATQSREKDRGGSSAKGAPPMHALTPSAIRAFAHRRMALSALRANSSLSVRLTRYNAHMAIARTLESAGGAQ
ncbi:hypothetical protein [Pseudomonas rhodesiae]|uniref:hypothetical protein n=1 Tax=Pseudomonas rhodesiae TaxID=76760 RepID=UPI0032B29AAE